MIEYLQDSEHMQEDDTLRNSRWNKRMHGNKSTIYELVRDTRVQQPGVP